MSKAVPPEPTPYVDDIERLRAELATLRADVEKLGDSIRSTGLTALDMAKMQGVETVDRVRAEAEALAHSVKDAGRQRLATFEQRVREQPLAAVSIAFGAGMLMAIMRGRR
jgi:ElaB/YqjD/DUF883 family membrane-anchored ribosome-binding protein